MDVRVALLITLCVVIGCSDSAVEPDPDPGQSIPPKVGSTFTYREFAIDANGREVDNSSRTFTAQVLASDALFGGKVGLTLIKEDTLHYYVCYDSSGDVQVQWAVDGFTRGVWQTWPFGSRTQVTDSIRDSLLPTGGKIRTFILSSYNGSLHTTTPAGSFHSHKMSSMTLIIGPSDSGVDSTIDVMRWYAPALGMQVKTTTDWNAASGPHDRRIKELISYSLR